MQFVWKGPQVSTSPVEFTALPSMCNFSPSKNRGEMEKKSTPLLIDESTILFPKQQEEHTRLAAFSHGEENDMSSYETGSSPILGYSSSPQKNPSSHASPSESGVRVYPVRGRSS